MLKDRDIIILALPRWDGKYKSTSLNISIELALIAIIGGRATIFGPVLGAFLLRPLSEITSAYFGGTYLGVHLILYGILLMIAVLFIPKGLVDLFKPK